MYSRLDPIFKTQLRQAETLDTRQGIRRQNRVDERGNRDNKDKGSDEGEVWEDQTNVSIAALKNFLEQLSREAETKSNDDPAEHVRLSTKSKENSHPEGHRSDEASRRAAYAAGAYERTYRATHKDELETNAESIPSVNLSPEELRIINNLIKDLSSLLSAGKEFLILNKSESFLQSIVDAVNHEIRK